MRIYITNNNSPLEENFDSVQQNISANLTGNPITFGEADITPGASCTALLVDLKDTVETLLPAAPVALFFLGDKINKNMEAWGKIGQKLKDIFERISKSSDDSKITIDNHVAAAIAFCKLQELEESKCYELKKIYGINGHTQEMIDCTDKPVDEQYIGTYLSYLCVFELDSLKFHAVCISREGDLINSYPLTQN